MTIAIRSARPGEASLVLGFIRELAEYERLLHEVTASEADIEALLFSPNPRAFCDIALLEGEPVGFAMWFYNLSTFLGRHGVYLEDVYVRPQARGHGAGKALLARLARRCVEEGLGRMDWSVLDWNASAQEFYDSLGATMQKEWIGRRLTGDALARLAELDG
ncbi:MAG TPA: GNAT family N-acetyltransferase [Caulobacteraceae bacterium]|jgi:GNAT superfamily N-acetyltransferase